MAVDNTYIIALENLVDQKDFIPSYKVDHFLILDEGHDRPVWSLIGKPRIRLIPSCPESILLDGIIMLACFGLQNQDILPKELKKELDKGFCDLSEADINNLVYEKLSMTLEGYAVNIYAIKGNENTIHPDHFKKLKDLGIKHRVFAQVFNNFENENDSLISQQ